jgi:hypothetical protein
MLIELIRSISSNYTDYGHLCPIAQPVVILTLVFLIFGARAAVKNRIFTLIDAAGGCWNTLD